MEFGNARICQRNLGGCGLSDCLDRSDVCALARRGREFPEELPLLERVRDHFRKDWESYTKVEVSQALVEQAGEFAEIFALRAYDSI